jgi:hypothetical protein
MAAAFQAAAPHYRHYDEMLLESQRIKFGVVPSKNGDELFHGDGLFRDEALSRNPTHDQELLNVVMPWECEVSDLDLSEVPESSSSQQFSSQRFSGASTDFEGHGEVESFAASSSASSLEAFCIGGVQDASSVLPDPFLWSPKMLPGEQGPAIADMPATKLLKTVPKVTVTEHRQRDVETAAALQRASTSVCLPRCAECGPEGRMQERQTEESEPSNVGSRFHHSKRCTPCRFVRSRRGCKQENCTLCHFPHRAMTDTMVRRAMRKAGLEHRMAQAERMAQAQAWLGELESK